MAAQQMPKRQWILWRSRRLGRNATYKCPRCRILCSSYYNDIGNWRYCPHCGEEMDGVTDIYVGGK